jgi:hypothetical protein
MTTNQLYFRMFHTEYTDAVENNNKCLTSPINDGNLYCRPRALYNPFVTGGNDPTKTTKSKYAETVGTSNYLSLTVAAAVAAGFLKPDGTANVQTPSFTQSSVPVCPVYSR